MFSPITPSDAKNSKPALRAARGSHGRSPEERGDPRRDSREPPAIIDVYAKVSASCTRQPANTGRGKSLTRDLTALFNPASGPNFAAIFPALAVVCELEPGRVTEMGGAPTFPTGAYAKTGSISPKPPSLRRWRTLIFSVLALRKTTNWRLDISICSTASSTNIGFTG